MTDLRDTELFVRYDEGDGPPIVYLHGINSDASDWRVVIDTIGPGYRHIAPDLLGFGESPKPLDVDYTADDHTATIDAMVERLGIDEPFLLVGYSLGGDIAIRYASTYPGKLRRLFLLSAPFYLPPETFARQGFGVQYVQLIVFEWLWRFVSGAKKKNDLLYQLADGRLEDAAKQFLRTDDVSEHWDVMSKNLENCIAKATFVDDLPKLSMPVTFALGVRDVIVHPDQTPALKTLKPEMEIRRIVGLNADHFMLVSLPEKVAAEIVRDEIGPLAVPVRTGSGDGTPLVLLHGIGDEGAMLGPLAEALGDGRRVLAPDLLGCGDSLQSQTLLYTLDDHVLALRLTLDEQLPDTPVRLVGQDLGANVALGLAARHPDLVDSVVAFTPPLLSAHDDVRADDASSDAGARVLALRDEIDRTERDPRAVAIAGDRTLQRAIPLKRSIDNAILAVDGEDLLARQTRPTRLVCPSQTPETRCRFLRAQAAGRPDVLSIASPDGPWNLLRDAPAAAAEQIVPDDTRAIGRAARARPASSRTHRLGDAMSSVDNQLAARGLLDIVLGLVLLTALGGLITRQTIVVGFALWVLWEGFSTIAGSFGLRRERKGWLPYFLIGALVLLVGAFLLLRPETSSAIVGVVVALRALYVGAANILVARAVGSEAPKPNWLLYLQGLLGIAIGLAIIFVPELGGRLLRATLGWYFVGSGVLLIAQAVASKRRVAREIRRLSYER